MIKDKKILAVLGFIVAIIALMTVFSLWSPNQDSETPIVDPSIPEAPLVNVELDQSKTPIPSEIDDDASIYIKNYNLLGATFSVSNALFINDTVQEFAVKQSFSLAGLELDKVSFYKRNSNSWGFTMLDKNGNRLFYVIVTELPEGNVRVEEFLL